jgi:hypothetical protein
MANYKKLLSIVIKITVWFMKVGLVVLGLTLLVTPGYALYLHGLGLISVVIGILTFNTTQQRLLAERGIRIPNALVGVLLIGGLLAVTGLTPGVADIELSNEQAELNGGDLIFQMDAANTGDGPTLGSLYFKYEVQVNGETVAETEIDEREFDRGETKTMTKNLLSLNELDESTRSDIEDGNYEILVYLQNSEDDSDPRTERYQGSDI